MQNKIYQFSKFQNVPYKMCLKFYFPTIVHSCKCYFCINTVQQFQNLQDSLIPIISTRSDQHYNQNLNYLHEFWRHFVIKIGTSIRLAKPLLLSIVLVICKFVTPCRAVPLNMYYFCSFYCLTHQCPRLVRNIFDVLNVYILNEVKQQEFSQLLISNHYPTCLKIA